MSLDDQVVKTNVFEIWPEPKYQDAMKIDAFVRELGYDFPFSLKEFSREQVKTILHEIGPSEFLKYHRIQEDISPKAPPKTAAQFVSDRLDKLQPSKELLIIDPYLFPPSPKPDEQQYADLLFSVLEPLLNGVTELKCVVGSKQNLSVQKAVTDLIAAKYPSVNVVVTISDDFHDRFWIADQQRAAVVGTSFNGIGSKVFLVDELNSRDVADIVSELKVAGLLTT